MKHLLRPIRAFRGSVLLYPNDCYCPVKVIKTGKNS